MTTTMRPPPARAVTFNTWPRDAQDRVTRIACLYDSNHDRSQASLPTLNAKENNMSRITRLVLVALALTWSASAFAADGAALYKTKCAPCHGADGSGNTPVGKSLKVKALASDEVQKLSDADLTKAIQKGKGKMPAFEGKLSDDELQAVVKFIRTFAK